MDGGAGGVPGARRGVVQALGTGGGLLRRYWVLFKLALTAVATGALFTKIGPIGELAAASMEASFVAEDLPALSAHM